MDYKYIDYTDDYVGYDIYDDEGKFINPNLALLLDKFSEHDVFVLQGGTRSGKTYNVILYFLVTMMVTSGVDYVIVRQSTPTLKRTVVKDFIEIATNLGIYDDRFFNKTDLIFSYNRNTLQFISGEDESKLRGVKSHVLYINEAPELSWESVQQLLFRNTNKVIYDYNPSYGESWLYDNILIRESVAFLKTTYKDNPYVTQKQIEEIESLAMTDPEGYRAFGLGERIELSGTVYNNFVAIEPENFPYEKCNVFVVDFGFSPDPTAITKQYHTDGLDIFVTELMYMNEARTEDILIALYVGGHKDNIHTLIGDGADPKMIADLRYGIPDISIETLIDRMGQLGILGAYEKELLEVQKFCQLGVNIIGSGAIRGAGSIKAGIRAVKRHILKVPTTDENIWHESKRYMYKMDRQTGKFTGEPINNYDHLMDTIRMGVLGRGRYF